MESSSKNLMTRRKIFLGNDSFDDIRVLFVWSVAAFTNTAYQFGSVEGRGIILRVNSNEYLNSQFSFLFNYTLCIDWVDAKLKQL